MPDPFQDLHAGHRAAAILNDHDGFTVRCVCGWSVTRETGLELFDAWAHHCKDTAADS